ncbi:MAG: P-loop NTPase [Rikenellaceae bacterium]|nr:P-loop NTPase [Rikenellaceae bacterium]
MKKEVDKVLDSIIHPETGLSLRASGIVESVAMSDERIAVTLLFKRRRDPFAKSIARQLTEALTAEFPQMGEKIHIEIKEGEPQTAGEPDKADGMARVGKIIAIASGKGGVGKSTVASNLAVSLAATGYRVGLLDADIYGPSQPKMFGVEDFVPAAEMSGNHEMIVPAHVYGVELMSVGFFISTDDALLWRGPMATGALRQLIHQTRWGELDYLLIDMPPGTGDVHLTILSELKIDGAVIVSTPQQVALADVRRGIAMFRSDKVNVPVLGIIENMAWFTPAELPDNRYYIFGRGGARELAIAEGIDLIGEIPIIQSVMDGADTGKPGALPGNRAEIYYRETAQIIVDKLGRNC